MTKIIKLTVILFFILGVSSDVFSMEPIQNVKSIIRREIKIDEDLNRHMILSEEYLYIPVFNDNFNGIKVKKYSLNKLEFNEIINIETDKHLFPQINPVINKNDNNIYFLDYSQKEIVQFNTETKYINNINVENEYNKGSVPSYISSYLIKDDYFYIINPFLYRKINPIQKYNFKGQLIKEKDTIGEIIKLLSNKNNIYYTTFKSLYNINENLEIIEVYKLNEDKYNMHSDFTFYKNQLAAVGDNYLTFYNLRDSNTKKYSLNDIKGNSDHRFIILSNEDYLYLVSIGEGLIYELEI